MSKVSEHLETLTTPLSEDQRVRLLEVLDEARRNLAQHHEDQKTAPRRNFISSAVAAGFTDSQADWLWHQQLSQTFWR